MRALGYQQSKWHIDVRIKWTQDAVVMVGHAKAKPTETDHFSIFEMPFHPYSCVQHILPNLLLFSWF